MANDSPSKAARTTRVIILSSSSLDFWDEEPNQPALAHHRTTALANEGFDLLDSLLTPDPEQRATAPSALHHASKTSKLVSPDSAGLCCADLQSAPEQRRGGVLAGARAVRNTKERGSHCCGSSSATEAAT